MSLINDALKRVENSINNNSPDKHKEQIPSFASSDKNKKLFFIALIGGTLFFTILILLITLIYSSSTPPLTPPNPIIPVFSPDIQVDIEKPSQILQPQEPSESHENESISMGASPVSDTDNDAANPALSVSQETNKLLEGHKDINAEFFESIVGLASKAFVKTPNPDEKTKAQEPTQVESRENYSLSTAQTTLNMIAEEHQSVKKVNNSQDPVRKFIDSLSITGVMISGKESMVLINNHVYFTDSIIDPLLNLTLVDIQPDRIVLKDFRGTTYPVEF